MKGLCIIVSKIFGLLLGDHDRASATPLKWSTETSCTVAIDHRDDGLLMEYLFVMYQTNIVLNSRL